MTKKNNMKIDIKGEQLILFRQLWAVLEREEEKAREHVDIARNIACGEMSYSQLTGHLNVSRLIPERLSLLRENQDKMLEIISRKRYHLLVAFQHLWKTRNNLSQRQMACYDYWHPRIGLDAKPKKKSVKK